MSEQIHALRLIQETSQSADCKTLPVKRFLTALIVLTLQVSVSGTQTFWNAKSHLFLVSKTSKGSDGMHGLCTAKTTLICVVLTCRPSRRFLVKVLRRPSLMAQRSAFRLLDLLRWTKYLRTTSVVGVSRLILRRNTSYQSNGTSTRLKNNLS